MTTPTYKRHPAKLDALKLAKILETYTIKKVCNDKYFSKKKYRRFLSMELINLTKDCYTCLVKAYHCPDGDRSAEYKQDALLCISAFMAQLDVANNLYDYYRIKAVREYMENLLNERSKNNEQEQICVC